MEQVLHLLDFFKGQNVGIIFAALFAASEAIGGYDKIKSNGVFQLVFNVLKFLKEKVIPAKP